MITIEKINKSLEDIESRKRFASFVLGFYCFQQGYEIKYLNEKSYYIENCVYDVPNNKNGRYAYLVCNNSFSFKIRFENKGFCFEVRESNYEFIRNGMLSFEYFERRLGNNILEIFYFCSKPMIEPEKDCDYSYISAGAKKNLISFRCFNFILGAGISSQYNIKDWNLLKNDFDDESKKLLGVRDIKDILEKSYNTSYGSFQVVKDLDPKIYYSMLENSILNGHIGICNKLTTLDGIAKILIKQINHTRKQDVITLNYDTLLEDKIDQISGGSQYLIKYNKSENDIKPIVINHIHGVVSYRFGGITKNQIKQSIVLTNEEYFKAYQSNKGYAYKSLNKALNKTRIFVGNSITDYEEQKVIKNNFDKHPNHYHFALLKYDGGELEFYRCLRLFRIGIIPIYFEDYYSMANFLDDVSKKL